MKPQDPIAIKELFDSVSKNYDFLNDLFSLGFHRIWKRQLLTWLKPASGEKWIDLCCGTGDLSLPLARLVRPFGSVIGVDFSRAQINCAHKRSLKEPWLPISWLNEDVLKAGLPSSTFDGVVMAYGLRNLSSPEAGLKEIHRLLKPGARAGVLDFNHTIEGSKNSFFQKFYLRNFVVPIASKMGLKEEYAYLEESLKKFPVGLIQEQIAINVGFQEANYKTLAGGQMGALLLRA
ncbi:MULTISPECIES: bifunctional demethylmenaquinone methyltransferase/2-methoxy-6-polyprenyl-1,4-benzoquinol methylase UbiE [Prochlorococcus]|uniref:2-phytyl-1,4-naphtoquinone methyltransferase n=1 Tax=Prochlorococcus marinus (strain SARG / CCMP1375 / SS120) TaxID=167539 RepID=Q7VDF0_PROMA|nr:MULTISPECIES: bifunctional demethylmenaquinone methyltransferase/2-methoxy-6-polyprenyl-1,4-benzoquinol methylase UbiE [Prochlorococcus]AAP99473.1 Methylase [Prochlorococcus marinus subsp. marinus str. CCMP1375]KGG11258.1 2-heptaprenyl-1,4-naphthoquinone methyltransferase [Prochlorococcus marinus str. LG]KGG21597.1 2-heptaprenyl-1,4-naphthoquinone methyltransferase [Prochlorococcus marinus str. SS2]KGG23061.1 2-heptaprenyl-1,4-naphthoquinone methyltransferase [Prochlorococcus marinus str. SS